MQYQFFTLPFFFLKKTGILTSPIFKNFWQEKIKNKHRVANAKVAYFFLKKKMLHKKDSRFFSLFCKPAGEKNFEKNKKFFLTMEKNKV
jgi:hypothetical protein